MVSFIRCKFSQNYVYTFLLPHAKIYIFKFLFAILNNKNIKFFVNYFKHMINPYECNIRKKQKKVFSKQYIVSKIVFKID